MLWDANKLPCLESCAAFSYTAVRQPTGELPTTSSFLFLLLAAAWVRVETLEQCRVAWLRGHTCGHPQLWLMGGRVWPWAVTTVWWYKCAVSKIIRVTGNNWRKITIQLDFVINMYCSHERETVYHCLISWRFAGFNWRRVNNFFLKCKLERRTASNIAQCSL
jgi:hypothetical protein